jgi:uncharacterized protein (TIGR01777 family)
MKIVIAGGTGFLGSAVADACMTDGHDVTVLTRSQSRVEKQEAHRLQYVHWDGVSGGAWVECLNGSDAVINLCGQTIARRWTAAGKRRILDSRLAPTLLLVEGMRSIPRRPRVLVNISGVNYYGDVSHDVTEDDPSGDGFLADMCRQWEEEARRAEALGVRVVLPRTGVVLGPGWGELILMKLAFMLFAGGPVGSGKQWFPWIHRTDVAGAMLFAVTHESIRGPLNLVGPERVTNKEFSAAMGKALRRPSWAPVPGFVLRLIFGEMSSVLLTGQKAVPRKLLQAGYQFRFPTVEEALRDIG